MSQQAYKGDVLQRIGGIGLILGGILTIVGTVSFPLPDDASIASYIKAMGDNPDQARISLLAFILGSLPLVAGLAAIYRAIATGAAAAWVRLGFYGYLVGTAMISVYNGLGLATIKAAEAGAATLADTLWAAADSVFAVSALTLWTSLVFLGIGLTVSTVYPKWIGLVLIIASAVAAIVGSIPRIFGDATMATELVFAAGAMVTTVMTLVLGIIITRREMKAMKA